MDYRRQDKRRHNDDYHHASKKPRLDHGHPPPRDHQAYSNGSQRQLHTPPTNERVNGRSKHNNDTPTVKHEGPLPAVPAITNEYAKCTFTHPSKTPREFERNEMQSYDRLEFLGDAYIEIISSRLIWSLYKNLPTGRMSSIRERLVKNETLAQFSVGYGFDKRCEIDASALPTRRDAQIKFHGDLFEAYVASVVLSDPIEGFRTAEEWLTELWMPLLEGEKAKPPDDGWKERLKKRVGGKGVRLDYAEERPMRKGKGIETYFMGVYLTGWGYENQLLGSGDGLSKKAAGMEAAKKALENESLIGELEKVKDAQIAKEREEKAARDQLTDKEGKSDF